MMLVLMKTKLRFEESQMSGAEFGLWVEAFDEILEACKFMSQKYLFFRELSDSLNDWYLTSL